MPVSAVAITLIVILLLGIVALIVSMIVIFVPRWEPPELPNDFWGYSCNTRNFCERHPLRAPPGEQQVPNLQSLNMCQLTCGPTAGNVWPLPQQIIAPGRNLTRIHHQNFNLRTFNFTSPRVQSYWSMAWNRFQDQQAKKIPDYARNLRYDAYLFIDVVIMDDNMRHDLETNEGYQILISLDENERDVRVGIGAENFYGARHALETLNQLMTYDDLTNSFVMLSGVMINDEPAFPHRGISMDTSRNFYPVEDIKRTLDGLAMVKMNTFHWHITDSQSFPMTIERHPFLTQVGAYSPKEVYTREDMKEITTYARARGIRIVPEFDQPAHVGEGWNFKDMLTCFGAMPWVNYCYQAPCGQFDPSVEELLDILEDIYYEMIENFDHNLFHMGADEVRFECWNTSTRVQEFMVERGWDPNTREGFFSMWGDFQQRIEERYDRSAAALGKGITPLILWSSTLTELPYVTRYLNASRHIIQWWGTSTDPVIQDLVANNFSLILSNFDRLYLDCGFSGWTSDGLNWCAPFKNWQGIYDNRLELIVGPANIRLALGAETTIWSEQIDPKNLDTRLWPRTAALAERLWRNPLTTWAQAETRMIIQRHRMVESSSVRPDRQYPEWCRQHQDTCPMRFF